MFLKCNEMYALHRCCFFGCMLMIVVVFLFVVFARFFPCSFASYSCSSLLFSPFCCYVGILVFFSCHFLVSSDVMLPCCCDMDL